MTKRYVIFIFCIVIYLGASAQQVDLTWSPEKKSEKSSSEYGFVGRVKDHFYTLRYEDKTIFLAKTRIKDMSLVWEKPISWSDLKRNNPSDKNLSFFSFRLFKDSFIFFFQDYSSKDDSQRLYAQKISFDGKPVGELLEVGKRIKQRGSRDGSFSLTFSPDSVHFLATISPYYDKYANEKFQFRIIDQNLRPVQNLELTLPFKDKDFGLESMVLSRKQEIYMLAYIDIPRKEKKDEEPDYYYEILKIVPSEKGKVREFEIKFKDKFIDKVDFILDKKDNVKCFGFYADIQNNGKRKDGINGIFNFNVVNDQAENINFKELDSKVVAEISGSRRANRDKGLDPHFKMNFFFEKQDGGMIVLAEEEIVRVVTTRTSNGNGGTSTSTSTHYYNNSIFAVNIGPDGKIIWYSHVPKLQHCINEDNFSSYHAMYVKGTIYIIYNDEAENAITKTYEKTMMNYMKALPVVVTISESGKSDKKVIGQGKQGRQDYLLKPGISDVVSENEAFFYADRIGKSCCVRGKVKAFRFGLLTIK